MQMTLKHFNIFIDCLFYFCSTCADSIIRSCTAAYPITVETTSLWRLDIVLHVSSRLDYANATHYYCTACNVYS